MADMKLEGMEELLKEVAELGRKGSKIENNALIKAAQPILDDAVRDAPKLSGDGKSGLKIGRPITKGDSKYVLVGLQKGDISEIFYMKFQEWGASPHQIEANNAKKVAGGILRSTKNKSILHPGTVARPFLGPAYERNKSKAIEIIKDELRKGLGLK